MCVMQCNAMQCRSLIGDGEEGGRSGDGCCVGVGVGAEGLIDLGVSTVGTVE